MNDPAHHESSPTTNLHGKHCKHTDNNHARVSNVLAKLWSLINFKHVRMSADADSNSSVSSTQCHTPHPRMLAGPALTQRGTVPNEHAAIHACRGCQRQTRGKAHHLHTLLVTCGGMSMDMDDKFVDQLRVSNGPDTAVDLMGKS